MVPPMSTVSFELDGDVAIVTMDDGKANALSASAIAEISAAFDRAAEEAKVVILTGREGKLCAGFDLRTLMTGVEAATALLRAGCELYLKIYAHPQPVVVASTGHAIAGGALVLGVGDVRIGADGPFKIGLNEVAIGMPLPIFAHELALARLEPRHLLAATLGATLYAPKDAVEVGWLDRVVAPEALAEAAMAEARKLAKLPTTPYAITKQSMRRGLIEHVRATLEDDIEEITSRMTFG